MIFILLSFWIRHNKYRYMKYVKIWICKYIQGLALQSASGAYILENTLLLSGGRENFSQCNFGEKYDTGFSPFKNRSFPQDLSPGRGQVWEKKKGWKCEAKKETGEKDKVKKRRQRKNECKTMKNKGKMGA